MLLMERAATKGRSAWPEPGLGIPDTPAGNLRVPDPSYHLPGHLGEDYPARAPDLCVEVRSKGQAAPARQHRPALLREQGCPARSRSIGRPAPLKRMITGDRRSPRVVTNSYSKASAAFASVSPACLPEVPRPRYRPYFSRSLRSTRSGTTPFKSPPREAASFTSVELTKK
ncbi:MAG: hypothetical protein AMXMBFR80_21030 [Dehalococcoidia bacterium]